MISIFRTGLLCIVVALAGATVHGATPLTLGASYAGTITVPGQTNAFTFTGAAGQRLFFDSLDLDTLNINVSLLSPGGVLLYNRNDDFDAGPWTLTEAGTFTVVIYANGSTTGNYSFRLLDLSTSPQLPIGSKLSDQLSPPLACNAYKFNGTRGQRINFQWVSFSTNQWQWELVSPANAVIAQGQYYQNLGSITLPMDGSYSLLIQGTAAGSTPLTFQILATDVSDTPGAAGGFGVAHSGNISANVTNSYAYTAPAGLPVYFDTLDASGQSLVVDLMDPTGVAVFSVSETSDAGPYVLPRSGTYTLNVRGPGGASGNYNFRLLDLSTSPVLPLNTVVSNSLAGAYQTEVYRFDGSAGQRLYYDSQVTSFIGVQTRILGPDGQTPMSSAFYSDQGPFTLQATGTYYFFVQNIPSAGTPYQFNLLDVGTQPAFPLNTDVVGTVPGYATVIYQLTGNSGQKLYFNGKGNPISGAYWALYDSRNGQVSGASANFGGDFEITLPYSANYALVFTAGTTPSSFSNQVSTFNYSTNALTLGTAVTNNIFNAGERVVYSFNGTVGQRIYYDANLSLVASVTVTLLSPHGVAVASGNAAYDFGPLTLMESGTYTLVFDGSTETTGPISFSLLDVAAQPVATLNSDLTGIIGANSSVIYRVPATIAQKLYFNGKGTPVGSAYWSLYDPWNSQVSGASANFAGDFEPLLPYSGEYVLVFSTGNNSATYSNQVNTFVYTTNALTLGTTVTNNFFNPGDQVFYTFAGTVGQRIYIDSLLAYSPGATMTLYSPDGVAISSANAYVDQGPLTLRQTGTYTLQLDGNSDFVGPINFRVLDLGAQPTLPLNTDITGNIGPNASLIYMLNGTVGQQLYFNGKNVAGNGASWNLYGPNDVLITGNNLVSDFEVTLPFQGRYAVVLSSSGNPVSFTNQVNTFSLVTNTLVLSGGITNTIVNPGDQLYYTFTGTAGQRIYFDSRRTNSASISATLLPPSSVTPVFSVNSASDSGPFTLTQNGIYTLWFDGSGDTTGVNPFNLLDLASATPITIGTPVSDSLADQTQTRLYKFTGTAGQRLNVQSLSASSPQAVWTLFDPANQPLGNQPNITANIGTVTLATAGTYTIAIIGYGVGLSPLSYQFSVTDVSDAPVASSGFGVVNSGTVNGGQTNTYTYTASAGTVVFFDSQDNSGQSLEADLFAPDGTMVFAVSEISDNSTPYTLPRSGTYTLNLRGYNGASGNYSFRLLDLGASPQLAFDTEISGTLANPYQTDVYKVTTSAGQSLFFDGLTNDANYPSVLMTLIDPGWKPTSLSGVDFQTDRGPFGLQYSGTGYLFLKNAKNAASPYSFQLINIAAHPMLPINVSVTNTLGVYDTQIYRYDGIAGQKLYFRGQPENPSGNWTLFDPQNSAVAGGSSSLTGDLETTLPYNGAYALVFTSYSSTPGTNVFQVNDFNYATNAYTIGSTVVDALNRPGERRFYTFTGTVGQQLYYDALTNDPANGSVVIAANLYNAHGGQEGVFGRFSTDRGPFKLQESGTYTLVIDANGSGVGPYAFRLLDIAAQPALPINAPVSATLDVYPSIAYRYSGTAGQRLYFQGQPTNPSGSWALYDVNNASLGSSGLSGDFEVTFPATGNYTLIAVNYGTTAASESFQVNDYTYFTNAYTIGTTVVDAINRPGERKFYTFAGTAGQRLVYNALTNDPPGNSIIVAQLLNPQGNFDGSIGGRFSNNHGPFTLQETGTYTLLLDGQGSSIGAFAFQLLDVSTQPALPLSVSITNSLGVFPLEVYQYAGTAGQHLYFRGLQNNLSGYWTLFDPNNINLGGAGLAGDFQATLPLSGTYVLILGNYSSIAGPEVFQVNPFNNGEQTVFNRAPVLAHISDQVVPAGVQVTFTAQATDADNNSLTYSLDPGSPAGATINPSTGVFSWTPPVTGLSSVTPVTVRVTDNGNPSLSAAQTMAVEVIAGPLMIDARPVAGGVNVSWHSAPGKHYRLQYKNEIADATWQAVGSDIVASALVTTQLDTGIGARTYRFYRVQDLDPVP